MAKERPHGTGTIQKLRNGRFWVRGPLINGKQKSLGTFATYEEAEDILKAFVIAYASKDEVSALYVTFGKFGAQVLDQRELDDTVRGLDRERYRWNCHLASCDLAGMPINQIETRHVAELVRTLSRKPVANKDKRGKRKLSNRSVKRCLSLVSIVFRAAIQRGLCSHNPTVGVEVLKRTDEDTEEVWTFLTPEEQQRLLTCEAIPLDARLLFAFALFTGIRQGELHHNMLKDLHVDGPEPHLYVRYGSKNRRPKGGSGRKAPLLPQAILAAKQWLEMRKTYWRDSKRYKVRADEGVIFPTRTGARRRSGKTLGNGWRDKTTKQWVDRLQHYYQLAGIPYRPGLHWHCLRHTCATSLLEGWWGPPWSLEEVKEMLGHSSVAVTQRYAHHAGTRLRAAVRRMPQTSDGLVTALRNPGPLSPENLNDSAAASPARLELATPGLGKPTSSSQSQGVGVDSPPQNQALVTSLAGTLLDLVAKGQGQAALALAVSMASAMITPLPVANAAEELPSKTA